MSNPNKHSNLNKDEFLKLLKTDLSDTKKPLPKLDEFDKEALEGFESFGNEINAELVISEIDKSISNRVGEGVKKHTSPFVWIGAAASVALVIILSVFAYNKTKPELTESNIALTSPQEQIKSAELELKVPAPNSDASVTENTVTNAASEAQNSIAGKDITSRNELELQKNESNQTPAEQATTNGYAYLGEEKKAPQKTLEEDVASGSTNGSTSTSMNDVGKPAVAQVPVSAAISATEVNADLDTKSIALKDDVAAYPKAAADKFAAEKKAQNNETEKLAKSKSLSEKEFKTKEESKPSLKNDEQLDNLPAVTQTTAFYIGGELAIKKYVLDYLKKENIASVLKGTFKISASINPKGYITVKKIVNTTNDCTGCDFELIQILSTMPKWSPATQNGKAIASDKEFVLIF